MCKVCMDSCIDTPECHYIVTKHYLVCMCPGMVNVMRFQYKHVTGMCPGLTGRHFAGKQKSGSTWKFQFRKGVFGIFRR